MRPPGRGLSSYAVERRDQGRNAPEGEQVGGAGFVAALHADFAAFFAVLQSFLQVLSCFAHADLQALSWVRICTLQSLEHLASAGEGARPAPSTSAANPTTPAVSFLMMSPLLLDFLVTTDAADAARRTTVAERSKRCAQRSRTLLNGFPSLNRGILPHPSGSCGKSL